MSISIDDPNGWAASIKLCEKHRLILAPAEARRIAEECPDCRITAMPLTHRKPEEER